MRAADARRFAEEGFIVLSGLLDEPMLAAVLAETDLIASSARRPGTHSLRAGRDNASAVFEALFESRIWKAVRDLTTPGDLELHLPEGQLVVNSPPNEIEPLVPHVDGHRPGTGRPDSFTLLVALLLTDQMEGDSGNLYVWPRSHLAVASFLAERGPTALQPFGGSISNAMPGQHLARPIPVCGRAGDVIVAHPLLGHATGPNSSTRPRRACYFRLRHHDHARRWQRCLTDPLLEYATVG